MTNIHDILDDVDRGSEAIAVEAGITRRQRVGQRVVCRYQSLQAVLDLANAESCAVREAQPESSLVETNAIPRIGERHVNLERWRCSDP